MKILIILPGGVHQSGRICVIPALLAYIERLASHHEVTIAALRQHREYCTYPLFQATVINLGSREGDPQWLRLIKQWRRLKHHLVQPENRYDLIHAFWLDHPGIIAWLAGKREKTPVIASLGGGEMVWLPEIRYGGFGNPLQRIVIRKVLRAAHTVTAGSRHALRAIERYRPDSLRVPLFPESISFRKIAQCLKGPPWRLLYAASINRVKDPFTLLRALRIVVDQQPETFLDWVGEDTLNGVVQQEAARLGLTGNVVFHGFQEYAALSPFFERAHVYVQSSLHESQGVAVCEAAAAGVPIVGTAVGLLEELAPIMALSVPTGDASALAQAICSVFSHPEAASERAYNARKWATAHDAEWTLARFESIYRECLSSRPSDKKRKEK